MSVLSGLEPKKVFYFFEEITKIPHGSRNTKAISDYCVAFAKERGLEYYQDEKNNVILIKEATSGYEKHQPVILQGHLDMVCVKEEGVEIDFTRDALPLMVEDGFVTCGGTTLGGDDGIAVAYGLALLDDETLRHPRLEVVFTSDEEIGMLGAQALDTSMLKGRRIINLDSDEEGRFLASCAGGLTADCTFPVSFLPAKGRCLSLTVEGLQGGHSGGDIHKERANAGIVMAQALYQLHKEIPLALASFYSGTQDNAIPRSAEARIYVAEEHTALAEEKIAAYEAVLKKEYAASDAGIRITVKEAAGSAAAGDAAGTEEANPAKAAGSEGANPAKAAGGAAAGDAEPAGMLDASSMEKAFCYLLNMPNGVQHWSMEIAGLVETSLNAGIFRLEPGVFRVCFSVRSSVASRKKMLAERLKLFTESFGGKMEVSGDYPAWEFKKDSPLRKMIFRLYETLFGVKPKLEAVHAGLECGIFSEKIPGLDCVSCGPTNYDIHTTKERLKISSVEKYWQLLRRFLEEDGSEA